MIQKQMYEQAFKTADITSQKMQTAIQDWYNLYYNSDKTKDSDPCQQIAYTIVRKLTKATFAEYKASSKDDFTQRILDDLYVNRNKAMQQALIGGVALIKPVPMGDTFLFMPVPRNNILVFGRNAYGEITDMGSWECSTYGNQYYTLLERRTVGKDGLTITNSLYKSPDKNLLGQPAPLNSIPRYEMLVPEMTLNIDNIGLIPLVTPIENCVDGSPDAVSVYAKATGLIHNIDHNEALLDGEFDKGQSRLIVSADMLRPVTADCGKNAFSNAVQTMTNKALADDLFTAFDEDPESLGITIFSPALREQSFLARKQEYLRNAESIIGLKRGLLSEVEAVERTATEIASSEGDYSLTIIDFQNAWEHTTKQLIRLCGKLGTMYNMPGAHEFGELDVSFDWGNGVLYDAATDWNTMLDMVARGMLKPEIPLAIRYNMPYETEEDLAAIRAKYMPAVENMMGGE